MSDGEGRGHSAWSEEQSRDWDAASHTSADSLQAALASGGLASLGKLDWLGGV